MVALNERPLLRQTHALVVKNFIINVQRRWNSTGNRAFALPVIFIAFIAFARFLFVQPAKYGIGKPQPVKDLADTFSSHSKKLVFINNGLGSDVDGLIETLAAPLRSKGTVLVLNDSSTLVTECKQTLQGVSDCFGAVVFESSPSGHGGSGKGWNYTLRADSSLSSGRVNVDKHTNDVENFLLPLQFAVDKAIAQKENSTVTNPTVSEYIFTSESESERQDDIRQRYMSGITGYISAALFIAMVGIIYHLTGFQAREREAGLSTLIEAMGGSKAARILSYHIAFDIIYFPSWVVIALILYGGVFHRTSVATVLVWHILSGLSVCSWAIFLGSVFKRAQLSGISTTIASLGLGVIAQVLNNENTAAYVILGFLFPPCNYVFFSITAARFEGEAMPMNLVKAPPKGHSTLPGIVLWVFLIVQIIVYPYLAALIERYLFDASSPAHRSINSAQMEPGNAVELRGFTKRYPPGFMTRTFGKNKESVTAVQGLDLNVLKGQIMVLLGANGSGKTTTLEALVGLAEITEGEIRISTDGSNAGIGVCPQKNVLWDDLTVEEHVRMWNKLKCTGDKRSTLRQLIDDCDLHKKRHALAKTLSGGQKRKLQLAAMFTGGSKVCAIDEVSSGLDPLSRRKIWDIILAARGERSIIMTTHFLDEADLLADHIAILSKGSLKCEGSAVELKTRLGGGYRVHTPVDGVEFEGVPMKRLYDQTVYNIPDSASAGRLIEGLEKAKITDYHVAGPTIEDVFLKVAEETIATRSENAGIDKEKEIQSEDGDNGVGGVKLRDGKRLSIIKQTWVMLQKRFVILQRNYLPVAAAIIIPIIAAGVTMVVFKNFKGVTCDISANTVVSDIKNFTFTPDFDFVLGPQSETGLSRLAGLSDLFFQGVSIPGISTGAGSDTINLTKAFNYVNSLDDMENYIHNNFHNVTPGGLFLSDGGATYAFQGDGGIQLALLMQNLVDNLLMNVTGNIATQYMAFDFQIPQDEGKTLIFIVYTGLAMAAFPAFFALYPTIERLRHVRALHYSNGVRSLPLWLAYTAYDFIPVLIIATVCTIIFAAATTGWYGLGYIFVVIMLYGLASIQLAYIISLISPSQLAAFAFMAGGQASMFLVYFIVYLSIITFAPPDMTNQELNTMHFVVSAISPISSLLRSLFVALNSFSIDCTDDNTLFTNKAGLKLYGGPILYLIVQSLLMFTFLVLFDAGHLRIRFPSFHKQKPRGEEESIDFGEKEVQEELQRVDSSNDSLRVVHLGKKFGTNTAVDDVTFGVPRDEIFALLGPNGAGKTTTINMIRGDMVPSSGEIFVQDISVTKRRAAARSYLGVCPQFDAMDRMTVLEHLRFYARVRGVQDIEHNVREVIRAVGLDQFATRMAEQLSGGNKRKLSLGIALMGNPAVLLLDEMSSGMDAAAKRVMWKTLSEVAPGRSLLLTTHSMEEAQSLATRAGILSRKMLAVGTTEYLTKKYADRYLVHLVLSSAPHSSEEEMNNVKAWVNRTFEGMEMEERSFHGQLRFSVPAHAPPPRTRSSNSDDDTINSGNNGGESVGGEMGVAKVFGKLEQEGRSIGAEFWSVSRTTMDMVFLNIVGRANVQEEGYEDGRKVWWRRWFWPF